MHTFERDQSGLTLVELLVVLAVMALLAALVVPNVGGFLSSGKDKAYTTEKETLQLAVDQWRHTIGKTTGPLFPILTGGSQQQCLGALDANGDPSVGGCNPYLDIKALADQEFLRSANSVKSANTARNTTATNSTSGSYGWYVSTGGLMDSFPTFTKGLFP